MPTALTQVGAYPLTGTGKLPNVDIASPGEVWSNKRASGVIVPGSLVRPVVVSGVGCVIPVWKEDKDIIATSDEQVDLAGSEAGGNFRQETLGIAMRQIMVPDINIGSQYNPALGPNEIVNLPIASGDWVRTVHTGVVHLTLVVPDSTYEEGDVLEWDAKGERPEFKAEGKGAWRKAGGGEATKGTGILIVHTTPRYYGVKHEAILTCRFLRSNQ